MHAFMKLIAFAKTYMQAFMGLIAFTKTYMQAFMGQTVFAKTCDVISCVYSAMFHFTNFLRRFQGTKKQKKDYTRNFFCNLCQSLKMYSLMSLFFSAQITQS
jgi:hypothetical protein